MAEKRERFGGLIDSSSEDRFGRLTDFVTEDKVISVGHSGVSKCLRASKSAAAPLLPNQGVLDLAPGVVNFPERTVGAREHTGEDCVRCGLGGCGEVIFTGQRHLSPDDGDLP